MSQYSGKIAHAKNVIKKVLQGINPVDDSKLAQESIFNNIDFARKFLDIYMLLDDVEEELTKDKSTVKSTQDFYIMKEQFDKFAFIFPNTSLTLFCQELDKFTDINKCRKIVRKYVSNWLVSEGIISEDINGMLIVSQKGQKIGFSSELRVGRINGGKYYVTILSPDAQKYILSRYVQN
jgi:hypothetical protein